MSARDDGDVIRGRLVDELERLLDVYCPGWLEVRGEGYLAPKSRGDLGSWRVTLDGQRRGLWYRHSQGLGGDVLALLAYCLTGAVKVDARTFEEARKFLGIDGQRTDPAEAERRRREAEARRAAHARDAAEARLRETMKARDLWRAARPAAGTLVPVWLAARGLGLAAVPPTLRFHPCLPYWWSPPRAKGEAPPRPVVIHEGPAQVGLVTHGETGRLVGVHLTWLAPDGRAKATITAPDGTSQDARKMRGACKGGHVRLAPPAAAIVVAEGIETSLAVMAATGLPTFAALSLGNLAAPLPAGVGAVVLAVDADEADPARAEATKRAAAEAHAARGLAVSIARPPAGHDFNSLYRGAR